MSEMYGGATVNLLMAGALLLTPLAVYNPCWWPSK